MDVPADRRARNPLITAEGFALLRRMEQHPHAPRWNVQIGDRITAGDHAAVAAWRQEVLAPGSATGVPAEAMVAWIAGLRDRVGRFTEHLRGRDPVRDWASIPTMSREDLAARLPEVVPRGSDLSRLIVYDTSGTTGHALRLPHHPRAVGMLHPLVERALGWWGKSVPMGPEVACVNVCAQARTHVFTTTFSVWEQAGFAKVNLNPADWAGGVDAARAFLADLRPPLVTTDPITLAELIRLDVDLRPAAILSTALALEPAFRRQVSARFGCPVLDWYSTTETGPIACSAPGDDDALVVLAPDVHVEAVDEKGAPTDGEGELCVTGGRNPYVPLLRYRTGDRGRVAVEGGRTVIRGLRGRDAVFFRHADGSVVNPVDLSRQLRIRAVLVQHAFHQDADGRCTLRIRPAPGMPVDVPGVAADLGALLGRPVQVTIDDQLGATGKIVPWSSASA